MIYFLSVLQLLFQLITVSSRQCPERNFVMVNGETKESSQNGFRYGNIQTTNFPKQFPTPYNTTFIINASRRSNDSQINLYLTQMFLSSRGVRFFQRSKVETCEPDGKTLKTTIGRDCRKTNDQLFPEILVDKIKLHDVLRVSTSCPFLEIVVTVPELYGYHYRTVDPFLFYVYGFNITYEIVPEKLGPKNESCNPKNCSNLGHCYLAENWRDFYCDCLKDHPGRYCEFSPHCDPENNITFCRNGGRCSINAGAGWCDCTGTGYQGIRCDKRNEQPKVSARTGCSNPNECPIGENKLRCIPETSKIPCSCSPSPKVPKDWVKYEAIVYISSNYTPLQNLSTVGYELQSNISRYFESTDLSDLHNVLARFEPPQYGKYDPPPEVLQIHFHGPSSLQDKVRRKLMNYLLTDENTYFFRKLVPLKGNMVLHVVPRVKFKSIAINRKLKIGSTVSISCTAYTGKSVYFATRDIRFRWFKDGLPVNVSIAYKKLRDIEIQFNTGIENETSSIIFIESVTALDGGLYTCEVTDKTFGDQICEEKEVEVILPPQIEIQPMSLTLEKRDIEQGGKVITCTDGSYSTYNPHNKSTTISWYKTNDELKLMTNSDVAAYEEITPQGQILRILKAEKTESFTCRGNNREGEFRVRTLNINVLDSMNSPSCKQRWEALLKQSGKEKLVWEWTAPDSTAIIPCPKGFIGYVQRQCIETSPGNVQWGRSDFSRCISDFLRKVNLTLQNAKRGFGHWEASNGIKLMDKLATYLETNQVLYPGEGEKFIAIMEDIWQYSLENGHVNKIFFEKFYGAIGKLLKIPDSCVQEKSVQTLLQAITNVAVIGAKHDSANRNDKLLKPHIVVSDVLLLQTLAIRPEIKHSDPTYTFPRKDTLRNSSLAWVKDKLSLTFPLYSEGLWKTGDPIPMMYYLTIAAYRNISLLVVPNENSLKRGSDADKKRGRTTIELISPVVQVSMPTPYYLAQDSKIRINFNLSKEHRSLVTRLPTTSAGGSIPTAKGTFYTCGALNNSTVPTKIDYERLRWSLNACAMDVKHNSYVECQCESLGIFGLLKVCNLDEEIREESNEIPRIIIAGFSLCILSCVVSVTLICVYLECRIYSNSLYTLKILDCLFIFAAVFIVLLGRTEVPSASWLIWSTGACSFLICSLSVQVTKALRILLMEASPGVPTFILPWLKNVSHVTLLSAITFSTVLPVWTATAAKIISDSRPTESAFEETSYVFAVFVGTVTVVVLVFLTLYYKAVLKTKSELDEYRQQNPCPSNNMYNSEMIWIFNYRIKTLNRGLCHTLILLVLILGIVLYENIQQSVFIQYFLGISVTAMGIFLFLSNVFHSEYPLLATLCSLSQSEKPPHRDPEKTNFVEKKGSQRKLYPISAEVQNGNGSIVGTTGLLPPPPPPALRNTRALLEDESSMSTVEEQSMDTFSTVVSFHAAAPSHKVSAYNKGYNRSIRSTGSNTTKSSNGSRRGSRKKQGSYSNEIQVPNPGKCLISLGDYILPSIRNTTVNDHRSSVQNNESSATSSSNYNYLPMPLHDNDNGIDIEKKISHDLSILLPQNGDHFGYPS